jgi:hypothetical protein
MGKGRAVVFYACGIAAQTRFMHRPATLAEIVPEDQTVIFTLTAPIKLPVKTAAAIEGLVRDGLPDSDVRNTTHGNHVRLRRVAGVPAEMPRVVGFVHNPEPDASLILALAEARLLGRDQIFSPEV